MIDKHEYVRRITTNILQKYCWTMCKIGTLEDCTHFNGFDDDAFITEVDSIISKNNDHKKIFNEYFAEGKSQKRISSEQGITSVRVQQILGSKRIRILTNSKEFSKILSEVLASPQERFYRYCFWKYNDRIDINPTVLYTRGPGYKTEHDFFDKLYLENFKVIEKDDCLIQDAGFSVRTYNALGKNGIFRKGIKTLSQLVESESLESISKMKGSGPKMIEEIEAVLKQHGFELKGGD